MPYTTGMVGSQGASICDVKDVCRKGLLNAFRFGCVFPSRVRSCTEHDAGDGGVGEVSGSINSRAVDLVRSLVSVPLPKKQSCPF